MNKLTEAFIIAVIQLLIICGGAGILILICMGAAYMFGGAGISTVCILIILLIFTYINLEE